MIQKDIQINRTGKLIIQGHRYEESESKDFARMFFSWMSFKDSGKFVNQRVNIPEGLTEGLVAKEIPNVYRKIKVLKNYDKQPTKFDCYKVDTDEIIEVKACSIPNDLTSWSPKPYFDKLYFLDFSSLDGKYGIYEIYINGEELKDTQVSEGETFRDQVADKRRPRFSVFEKFIRPNYKCSGIPIFEDDLRNYL